MKIKMFLFLSILSFSVCVASDDRVSGGASSLGGGTQSSDLFSCAWLPGVQFSTAEYERLTTEAIICNLQLNDEKFKSYCRDATPMLFSELPTGIAFFSLLSIIEKALAPLRLPSQVKSIVGFCIYHYHVNGFSESFTHSNCSF